MTATDSGLDAETPPATALDRALGAVEAIALVRLEERRAADVRSGHAGRRAAALREAGEPVGRATIVPPLDVFRHGRLGQLVDEFALDALDATLLVASLAPTVDDRFCALFRLLDFRGTTANLLTVSAAQALCAATTSERLEVERRLSPDGHLATIGCVAIEAHDDRLDVGIDAAVRAWLCELPVPTLDRAADFPATPLHTLHTIDDLVVGGGVRRRLDALLGRMRDETRVIDEWGYGQHFDHVRGVLALLHGPPGTGKTMAAAIIAREARLPAFRIDLAAIVSKYIGETEKQLAKIFDRAARMRCVLVFDEADALFGRRTEIGDAHDRYANQDVSFLLQRVEDHPGVTVLTTNFMQNLDEAFRRRIDVMIEFAMPGRGERERLWKRAIPDAAPIGCGVDLTSFAERYELSGAQIREASLDAAFMAAADGTPIEREHLERDPPPVRSGRANGELRVIDERCRVTWTFPVCSPG